VISGSWHSYPSIYNMGHRAIATLLEGPVLVEEKVDGSQFSFGKFWVDATSDSDGYWELRVKSKGAIVNIEAPPGLFRGACDTVKGLADMLIPEWTYRGESIQAPKHNSLVYDRVPRGNVILFDVNDGEESYLSRPAKEAEAARLGLEVVPLLHDGMVPDLPFFRSFLDRTSILGGQQIEGVVIKPVGYDRFGIDKKCLMGKFVSEAFKEVHNKSWRESNPTRGDVVAVLIANHATPARFQKAVIHLREQGLITDSVKDIGVIIRTVQEDIEKEEADAIAAALVKHFLPEVIRGAVRAVPQWYKDLLLAAQFERPAQSAAVLLPPGLRVDLPESGNSDQ